MQFAYLQAGPSSRWYRWLAVFEQCLGLHFHIPWSRSAVLVEIGEPKNALLVQAKDTFKQAWLRQRFPFPDLGIGEKAFTGRVFTWP